MAGNGWCWVVLQSFHKTFSAPYSLENLIKQAYSLRVFTRSINFLFFMSGIWPYFRLSFGTLIFNGRQNSSIFVKISLIFLDYNLHHVCTCMGHAVFSETTTVTHFW